jgi:3-dehydroquinate synthase
MKAIRVALGPRSYPIVVTDSYRRLPAQLAKLRLGPVGIVVSHASLLRRYGAGLLGPLRRAGWRVTTVTVPESERSKSIAAASRLLQRMTLEARMRPPVLFAFGGGVIGDLAGFAAALFRRGVPYVQVPTTLLAQVDSSIGGKVGVDLPQAKNMAGAFYQPRLVWNNLGVLGGLPMRQRRSGLSEVIKYGVMADARLFRFLEQHLEACLRLELRALRVIVERSCRIKAGVVSRDERETTGLRAQLNYGHTLGHALEAATGYRRYTHGEAIAVGMAAAARMSVELGRMEERECGRIVRLLAAAGLPVRARGVSLAAVLRAMRFDKKFVRGRPRWVLPDRIGRVRVTEAVPERLARRVLAQHVAAR